MAIRAQQEITVDGLEATYHAASGGGDKVLPGSILHVVNGDASDKTLTITTHDEAFGQAVADAAIVITAGESRFVEVPTEGYRGSDGYADLSWSATTSVTFAVLRV